MYIEIDPVVDEEAELKTEQGQRFTNATRRPWRAVAYVGQEPRHIVAGKFTEQTPIASESSHDGLVAYADVPDNAALIVEAVNSYAARTRLLQTSLDLLNDVYNSRASQRFSAIGLRRIKSHIAALQSALNPKN